DGKSIAVNPIRDSIFKSNPELYYKIGNASTIISSLGAPMASGVPIEQVMATRVKGLASSAVGVTASNALMDRYDLDPYVAMGIGIGISKLTYMGIDSVEVDTTLGITASGGKTVELVSADNVNIKTDYGEYSTKIDGNVSVVETQELYKDLAETFKDANYRTVITNEDTTVYRSFGYNADAGGAFATTTPSSSRIQTRIDSALLPEWKNSLQYEAEIIIPKGTTLNIGRVKEQFTISGARLAGDADQILLPRNWDLNWIKSIKNISVTGRYTCQINIRNLLI